MTKTLQIFFSVNALLSGSLARAGTYDSLPLRSALSPEPHFQTNLGRDGHRFESGNINRYRLYNFYARQAQFHLVSNQFSDLLLPYPGLEGGRRGHWGNTNEKLSSAELKRTEEPKYHRIVNRGENGDAYVCVKHDDSQSVCLFAKSSASMSKVVLKADMRAPVHLFSHKVDRLGFDMELRGQDYLINRGAEWYASNGDAEVVSQGGYHLYEDKVIYRRTVGGAPLLDHPTVAYEEGVAVYSRHLMWGAQTPELKFHLPESIQKIDTSKVKIKKDRDAWIAVIGDTSKQLVHRVSSSQGNQGISMRNEGGKVIVSFDPNKKGTKIQMSTWVASAKESKKVSKVQKPLSLGKYLKGGARHFKKDITVSGVLDADPAARGTGYAIDDIPVPVENPYGVPMTTSGIAFDADGSAYVPTLVGDVWKVTGLDSTLKAVKWQRYASGMNSPLGIEVINGVPHVLTQHQIVQLIDLNKDGEADFIKPFTEMKLPNGRLHNLEQDAEGNIYFTNVAGIHQVSADGKSIKAVSGGSRNPLGLSVRADGLALSDASEGNKSNGACSIFESKHPENEKTVAKQRRILYLPRGIDNSPGSRIFMNSDKFGPLGKSLMGVSYGTGRIYQIMRDANNGSPQAALRLLPGEFSSGSARLETNPKDGQIYIVGFDGWGDFGVDEGSLNRVRYTGKEELVPLSWKAHSNGVSIKFNIAVDPESITAEKMFLQQWNYIDSAHTYGSGEYSVKNPDQLGHDRLKVKSVSFSKDMKEMFIVAPDILPAMSTQIYGALKSKSGVKLKLDLYATINQLPKDALSGDPAATGKKYDLVVPYKANNGNTYETITAFFDARAGKAVVKRAVGPVVPYKKDELNYEWINTNIIMKQNCIACHGATGKYDFSSYESLMTVINLKEPSKSHALGMMGSGSMPPYPMPTVPPEMQKALLEWIEAGAPQ